jgi:spore coat protein U-like protein
MRVGFLRLVAALVLSIAGVMAFRPVTAQSITGQIFEPIGCTISATLIAFGRYDVNAPAPLVALGSVSYNCQESSGGIEVSKRIIIRISAGSSGRYDYRYMFRGNDLLKYNLYLDSNFRKIWGDGTRGTDDFSERVRLTGIQTIPVYGRVWERQDVGAGSYGDECHATIEF